MMDEPPPLNCPKLLPHAVERLSRSGAKKIVNAAVEDIPFALPGCTQTTRQIVQLEDKSAVAVHLGVAARRQPSDARTNDDDVSQRIRHN